MEILRKHCKPSKYFLFLSEEDLILQNISLIPNVQHKKISSLSAFSVEEMGNLGERWGTIFHKHAYIFV